MHPDKPLAIEGKTLRDAVIYRDDRFLVLNKPSGLPVHGGPSAVQHLELHLEALTFGARETPRPAHRLDADTSGCLLLGRKRSSLRAAMKFFAEGQVEKTYWAVVQGLPPEERGTIELPLRKETKPEGWRMVVDRKEGQRSVTRYRLLAYEEGLSWLELKPATGRTHQLRVHCAASGFPMLGDPFYNRLSSAGDFGWGGRLHLHARALCWPLAEGGRQCVEAPPPDHMLPALRALGYDR